MPRWGHALALSALAACSTGSPSQPGTGFGTVLDPAKQLHFQGTVLDRATRAPLPSTLVVIETGGAYRAFDGSAASPYYVAGTITRDDGRFVIDLPPGRIGVHTFTEGYYCGHATIDDLSIPVTFGVTQVPPEFAANRPQIVSFAVDKSIAVTTDTLTFTADVEAGDASPADPLSDEIIVVEPKTAWAGELEPPGPGSIARGFPNGRYTRSVPAPSVPGTYTYTLVTMSEGCVVGPRQTVTVTVSPPAR